jgi:SAM-dependent methyltransferase
VDEIGTHNRDRFDDPAVVADYARAQELTVAERLLFDRHVPAGARVLDLGCGTGRTTPRLAAASSWYLGIDHAPGMVAAARRRHPTAHFEVGDAAELTGVADASVDVVVFAYNGIDYLADGDRARCLDEVRRVLVPGGTYVFSSHNPRALVAGPAAGSLPRRLAIRAVATLRRTARLVRSPAFRTGEGWTLDPARGGLHTHQATPARVERELAAHGLRVVERLGGDLPLAPRTWRTPWWYYAARAEPS